MVAAQLPCKGSGRPNKTWGMVYIREVLMRYLFVLLLAGCVSQEELSRQRAHQMIARHAPFCETLGYARGSDHWRQCIFYQEQQRQATQPRICTQVYGSVICQ